MKSLLQNLLVDSVEPVYGWRDIKCVVRSDVRGSDPKHYRQTKQYVTSTASPTPFSYLSHTNSASLSSQLQQKIDTMHVSTLFPLALYTTLGLAYRQPLYARNAALLDDEYNDSLYSREAYPYAEPEPDFDYDLQDLLTRDADADLYDFDRHYIRALLDKEPHPLYIRDPPKRQNSAPATKPEQFRAGKAESLNPARPAQPGVPRQPPHRQNSAPTTNAETASAQRGVGGPEGRRVREQDAQALRCVGAGVRSCVPGGHSCRAE